MICNNPIPALEYGVIDMAFPVLGFLTTIGDLIAGPIKSWQQRKQAKLESDLKINEAKTEAKIERLKTGQQADIAWENTSIEQSSWKDEWFTIVLSIPAILCFIPGMAAYVRAGFEALRKTPDWYQWAFLVAIGSSFGYRKIADFMALKKGD